MTAKAHGYTRAARDLVADDPYHSRVHTTPEIVSRIDPVVYCEPGSPGPLSAEQVRAYEQTGFLELSDLFTAGELAALQEEQKFLRANPEQFRAETLILEPDGRELRSIFQVHEQSTLLGQLARDHRLVMIAQQLLGDEVYIHQSRMNYKPGLFGKEFYWHSDFETWHVEDGMPRMRALSMSIALAPNTPFNGPLMLMPGSHRRYVRCVGETPADHYKQSLRKQEYGVPDPRSLAQLYADFGIATPTGPAGRIVVFDCNAMHGSNSNISPMPRTNIFLVYNSVGNRLVAPFSGKPPRPDYIATRREIAALVPCMGALDAAGPA